jgi:hypothetical protein
MTRLFTSSSPIAIAANRRDDVGKRQCPQFIDQQLPNSA